MEKTNLKTKKKATVFFLSMLSFPEKSCKFVVKRWENAQRLFDENAMYQA